MHAGFIIGRPLPLVEFFSALSNPLRCASSKGNTEDWRAQRSHVKCVTDSAQADDGDENLHAPITSSRPHFQHPRVDSLR